MPYRHVAWREGGRKQGRKGRKEREKGKKREGEREKERGGEGRRGHMCGLASA